jgi:Uma2 family endonuclease
VKTSRSSHTYTFDDFMLLVKEDQKADLIDGVIYMASPESTDANDLFGWLLCVMGGLAEERALGKVFTSRVAYRLGEFDAPEPDTAFVSTGRLHLVKHGYVDGPPDLALEIVAEESAERDYVRKREQYRGAGVQEYWIVDDDQREVLLLRLDARGRYREIKPRRGELHSQAMPGFWIRPDWLWQSPRPPMMDVLAEILQRNP